MDHRDHILDFTFVLFLLLRKYYFLTNELKPKYFLSSTLNPSDKALVSLRVCQTSAFSDKDNRHSVAKAARSQNFLKNSAKCLKRKKYLFSISQNGSLSKKHVYRGSYLASKSNVFQDYTEFKTEIETSKWSFTLRYSKTETLTKWKYSSTWAFS